MYEIKTEDVYGGFSKDKEIFDFSNYNVKSKYYGDSDKLAVGKIKDEIESAAIERFVRLNPKMYSFFVDDSSKYRYFAESKMFEALNK